MVSTRIWNDRAQQWQYKHFETMEDAEEFSVIKGIKLHNVQEVHHGSNDHQTRKI